jgi:hypothetical protein
MNTLKLQQDLIKAANNRDEKKKAFNGFYVKKEFETIIGPNHSQAFVIPNEQLYIDVEKVFNGREVPTFENVLYKIETDESYTLLRNDNTLEKREFNKKKIEVYRFENPNLKEKIYLDKKFMKYYDMDKLVIYGGNNKQPVRIYEDTEFIGGLAPVWIQD